MFSSKGTVVYIGGFEMPDKNAAAHRVLNNAKIFEMLGYNVVFCGYDKELRWGEQPIRSKIGNFSNIAFPYPQGATQWFKQYFDVQKYFDILKEIPDVSLVVAYDLYAYPLYKLMKFCKKTGIKIIGDCTEWYGQRLSLNLLQSFKFFDTSLRMRCLQKKLDGMIVISSYLRDYYSKSNKNIATVPPLVDLNDQKYNVTDSKNSVKTLVYSGSPSASKEALGEVVRCLNKFDNLNFTLNVVGITKEQFCRMYGIEPQDDKICFMGRVSHTEALESVKKADYSIIIRPVSRVTSAGFPTKFAEAISCNTAVIANNTSDLADYIKDGKNGFLVSLETLERDLYKILSSSEVPKVENKTFDYRNWTSAFEELFKRL